MGLIKKIMTIMSIALPIAFSLQCLSNIAFEEKTIIISTIEILVGFSVFNAVDYLLYKHNKALK